MGHTYRVGGESPADTYAAIGPRVGYTHVKDARQFPSDDGGTQWKYVPPGEGELPLAESIKLLMDGGYDGWLQFEHEKRWQQDLPEPDVVFPIFVAWAKKLLAS
jgi:fatty-acyl-CoA synthase